MNDIGDLVGHQPVSASELRETYHYRGRLATLSRKLAQLFREGVLDRRWEGNGRFGKYLYFRKVAE